MVAPGSGGYANGSNPDPPDGDGGTSTSGSGVLGTAAKTGLGHWMVRSGWELVLLIMVATL